MTPARADRASCSGCAAPLAHDQRYCLQCGARRPGPRRDVLALLCADAGGAPAAAEDGSASPARPPRSPAHERRRRAALPIALAALVGLVAMAGTPVPSTLAGGIVPAMTIVLPPAQLASAPGRDAAPPADTTTLDRSSPTDAGGAGATTGGGGDSSSTPGGGDTATTPDNGTGSGSGVDPQPAPQPTAQPAPIRHVFLVVLADTDLTALAGAGANAAPYFAGSLVPKGTLLTSYASVARGSLANGVALLSGQGPTPQTLAGCPTYTDVTPDTVGDDGQQLGDGCVYPFATGTVADQLVAAGKEWRAYIEDVGAAPGGTATCRRPALGAVDDTTAARPGDAYATARNPFAYFHSLTDGDACTKRDVGLDRLDADLARGRHAPALSYVVPNRCHDGSATPCAPGAPAGPAAADAFLATVVPKILASAAYADGGLLVVTSDGPPAAPTPPAHAAPQTYPNVGDAAAAGAGRVGALLISKAVRAGERDAMPANHFTLLRLISDLFELQPLGYAGASDLVPLPDRLLGASSSRR